MRRANVCLVGLVWLCLGSAAIAQTTSDSGVVILDEVGGQALVEGTYFDVRTMTGDGVGYRNGYTQLGLFSPYWLSDNAYIATHGRFFVTDNGYLGTNTGGVLRYYSADMDRIFGINGYYDYDRSINQNTYRQFTVGGEALGEFWDFRANGYIPTSDRQNFEGAASLSNTPYYMGNRIVVDGQALYEQSLGGGDFEFGAPVTRSTPWLRAYAGMYFYSNDNDDTVGFRGRFEGNISDDLLVGVQVTDDDLFGTNVNAVVDFRFAGFKATRYFPQWNTRERMMTQVQRNWRVATYVSREDVQINTIDPTDNQPYFVVHVDPGVAGGDGTYENPYGTMPANAPGADIVLVQRGNTTQASPLASNITLDNNTRLLGEGRAHTFSYYAQFAGLNVSGTNAGLPNFDNIGVLTNSGNMPFLTGVGNAVTLANNNEVASFVIENSTGSAIAGNGITNFNLHDLEVIGNAGGGIVLADASGTGIISNINTNTFGPNPVTSFVNPTFGGNGAPGGIVIDSGAAAPLDLTLDNVVMNQNTAGIVVLADDSDVDVALTDVSTNYNLGDGTSLEANGANLAANITNLTSVGNSGDGLSVSANGNTATVVAGNINVNANFDNGLDLLANNGVINFLQVGTLNASFNQSHNLSVQADNGSTINGQINEANLNGSVTGDGAFILADNGSVIGSFTLANAALNNNTVSGVEIGALNGSSVGVNVIDSTLTGNGLDAFTVVADAGSNVNLFVDPTDASGNGRDGLNFVVNGASNLDATFLTTNLSQQGNSAIFGTADNGNVSLTLGQVTADESGADGVRIDAVNGSNISLVATQTSISNSGQTTAGSDGINITANDSNVELGLSNATVANTNSGTSQDDGISLSLTNGSSLDGVITSTNLANNVGNAVNLNLQTNSVGQLALTSVEASGSGREGVLINLGSNSNLDLDIVGSNINGSGTTAVFGAGDGIAAMVTGASDLVLNVFDTSIDNNLDNGVELVANTASSITATIADNVTGSSLDNNGLTSGGSALQMDFDNAVGLINVFNTTAINAGGDAVLLNAVNGSNVQFFMLDSDLSDSGQFAPAAGLNFNVAGNSLVNALVGFAPITNTVGNTPQQHGVLFDVNTGGDLLLTMGFVDLSNHTAEGINGLVDGVGSSAAVSLIQSTVDNNGSFGVLLSATNGADLEFNTSDTTSISNNAADGVFAIIDGPGTTARFNFADTTIDNNGLVFGGDGLNVNPTNGGSVVVTADNTSFSGNNGQGIEILLDSPGGVTTYDLSNVTIDNNVAEGIRYSVLDGTLNLFVDATTISNNGQGGSASGVYGILDGPTAAANVVLSNLAIDGNSFGGVELNAFGGGTLNAAFGPNTSMSNNLGSDGLHIAAVEAGSSATLLFVGPMNVDDNAGGGVDLVAAEGAALDATFTGGLSASGNLASDGLKVTGIGPATTVDLFMFEVDGQNVFSNNAASGIDIALTNLGATSTLQLQGQADSNAENGLEMDLTNSNAQFVFLGGSLSTNTAMGADINLLNSDFTISSRIQNTTVNGNLGGPGIGINATSNSDVVLAMTNNDITQNNGAGFLFQANSGTHDLSFGDVGAAAGNDISQNNDEGIFVDLNHAIAGLNPVAVNLRLDGNTIDNNQGIGVRMELAHDTAINFSTGLLGSTNQGTITGNQDAGILIDLIQTASATFNVSNVNISGTTNGADASFNGEGFALRAVDSATITNSTLGENGSDSTVLSGNASHGMSLFVDSFALANNIAVNNVDITGNTGDGINFTRQGDADITNVAFQFNEISGNATGIEINAAAADTIDTYLVNANDIRNNRVHGISAFVTADADIDLGITNNTIVSNAVDGINFAGNLAATDNGNITSVAGGARPGISNNVINLNGDDGIDISSLHQVTIDNNDIRQNVDEGIVITGSSVNNGLSLVTDRIQNNLIIGNGGNGVFINSSGANSVNIFDNAISFSGDDGVALHSTGVRLVANLDNNQIDNSTGDGVEMRFVNSGTTLAGPNVVSMTGNNLVDNGRRGINILNAGTVSSVVSIGDGTLGNSNNIERSGLEGVYVVNTASTDQNVNANANAAMAATGSVFATPNLTFNFLRNTVTANGNVNDSSQVFDTSGLVLRVGTSDGGNGFTDQGGFADTRAGVVANVSNNTFFGQFGADVTFQSFVSTVNPATTGGQWTDQNTNPRDPTNDVFDPQGYQSDPLARLDLTFNNNSGLAIIATRTGAAYTNDEPIFKSRTQAQDNGTDGGADDDGPYGTGTRARNAQRLARRLEDDFPGGQLPPLLVIGASNSFLFPGMGQSTFRVSAAGNNFTSPASVGFFTDTNPFTGTNDANGVGGLFGGPNGVDNMPWGWSVLP